jgi:S-adenosylmethionine/arginine decarboxylase-like enzyme
MTPVEGTDIYKEIGVPGSNLVSITAGVILLESHICLHTWRELNYLRLEVSTCKDITPINLKVAIEYVVSYFRPKDIDITKGSWQIVSK